MLQALEQLFHARRILGFSYVAAFFMFGGSYFKNEVTPEQNELNQNLFEDQQQQLEAEVCIQRSFVVLCWLLSLLQESAVHLHHRHQ